MRRTFSILLYPAISLLISCLAGAQSPQNSERLTSIAQVEALTNTQAEKKIPVEIEGIVTYLRPSDEDLSVMEGDSGCYVRWGTEMGLLPGDRVAITGFTAPGFKPIIVASTVRLISHGSMPVAQPATIEDLIQSKWDSRYVTISGQVISAAMDNARPAGMQLRVRVPNGTVGGVIVHPGTLRAEDLLDADVRLNGVAAGDYDSKMQVTGVWLDINSAQDVEILHKPANDPWSVPAIAMDQVIGHYRGRNQSSRVKIRGTLTFYEPGQQAVLEQPDGHPMLVKTNAFLPLRPGDSIEATGFPTVGELSVELEHALLRPVNKPSSLKPSNIDWEAASTGKYAYNLVSMEGDIVDMVHDSRVDFFIISSGGHLFSSTLRRRSSETGEEDNSKRPEIGSHVRVTGVCFVDPGDHWSDRLWFDLHMRSLSDIVMMQPPAWWTMKKLAYVSTLLSVTILAVVSWAGMLDKRLRNQSAYLAKQSQEDAIRERRTARQEQQRSHILELISSSEPLAKVLQEIQSKVSSQLYGAACWFELSPAAGGSAELQRPTGPGIVCEELYSRDGISLGLLLATPMRVTAADTEIPAALSAGARLAELAIETRRLYSDLRHRSEHDLLTDIPNRFSMEKHLDMLMAKALRNEGMFGLIYVDLDRFKDVNDRYGHRTGDLYLREVTRRMKLQLRTDDVLARIGGDEFIVLVPIVRSHLDAEEIATRLQHCFDEPFELEEYTLLGSASVGLAVYPENGTTKEGLQRAADAAMYANKEARKQKEKLADMMQRA